MTVLYVQPHRSQYDAGSSERTRHSGCTWTSLANGIAATTGGGRKPSPDAVLALLPRSQETSPATPGWSLPDAVKAASKYGMALVNRTGAGFNAVIADLLEGHYVLVQGDSDRFGNATCSGAFDGDHCIGVHPKHRMVDGLREWWIDDPICPTGRWEKEAVLRRYAEKLDPRVRFARFFGRVPTAADYRVRVRPPVWAAYGAPTFKRRLRATGGWSADVSAPKSIHTPYGTKALCRIESGFAKGLYVNRDGRGVTVTKESQS